MVHQALHEHGPAQAAEDDRLTRAVTNPKSKVRKILDTTPLSIVRKTFYVIGSSLPLLRMTLFNSADRGHDQQAANTI